MTLAAMVLYGSKWQVFHKMTVSLRGIALTQQFLSQSEGQELSWMKKGIWLQCQKSAKQVYLSHSDNNSLPPPPLPSIINAQRIFWLELYSDKMNPSKSGCHQLVFISLPCLPPSWTGKWYHCIRFIWMKNHCKVGEYHLFHPKSHRYPGWSLGHTCLHKPIHPFIHIHTGKKAYSEGTLNL